MNKNYIFILLTIVCLTSMYAQENALNFDGSDGYVELGTNPVFDITSAITLEAWVYPTQYESEDNIITKFGDIHQQDSYILRLVNGVANFYVKINTSWYNINATTAIDLNTWTHIAGVYDGTEMKIFINGILNASLPQTGIINVSTSTLKIGKWNSVNSFHGNIDEVRIWNVARLDSEISSKYNSELTGNESGLVVYYTFNQGIANGNNTLETSLKDSSVNNINGTLTNFQLNGTTSNWVGGIDFSTLSLLENNLSFKNVTLYPNPSNGFIKLSGLTQTETYQIYNMLGRIVKNGTINSLGEIDIQILKSGIYLLKLRNGIMEKIIKN